MTPNTIVPHKLGFDFDGVIADTAHAFLTIAKEKHGYTIHKDDITDFDIENCTAMSKELIYSIFTEIMMDSISTGVKPMTGAVKTLSELSLYAPITIITARPNTDPIHAWLNQFFHKDVTRNTQVIAMGDHDDKVRYVKDQGLEYFIDDRADTCQMMADVGLQSIVFDHPWNRGRHQLPMVKNWDDISQLIQFAPHPHQEKI